MVTLRREYGIRGYVGAVIALVLFISGSIILGFGIKKSMTHTLTRMSMRMSDYKITSIDCFGEINICSYPQNCIVGCNTTNYILSIYFGDDFIKGCVGPWSINNLPQCECCTQIDNNNSLIKFKQVCANILANIEDREDRSSDSSKCGSSILTSHELNKFVIINKIGDTYNVWKDISGILYLHDDVESRVITQDGTTMITWSSIMIIIAITLFIIIIIKL